MEFLGWLESTWLAAWVRESMWGYPIILTAHAIGMAAVVGLVLMIDLRMLGYASRIPIAAFDRLFSVARAGVVVNLVSGLLLFITDARQFMSNPAFQIKLSLIAAGAVAIWVLLRAAATEEGEGVLTHKTKTVAALSIVFWMMAITAGRLTAYV